jgi:pimeloyl-ACP methyl ester carboxylesterase
LEQTGHLLRPDGIRLAWSHLPGKAPTIVFLPGFHSDMSGSKALSVLDFCRATGQAMLRLDYSGHGESGGAFEDGCIGQWTEEARAIIEHRLDGPMILVGSSMGGWIALLLTRAFGARVAALVGIAAAPDFTETLMWQSMAPIEQKVLMEAGKISVPSEYGTPLVITRHLIEDGRAHLVLGEPIALDAPVRLLQGQRDPDVPWETALKLASCLTTEDVQVILLKDGDHRLSRPGDLALLNRTLAALLGKDGS